MNLIIRCIVVLVILAPLIAFGRERREVGRLEKDRQTLREQLWTEQQVNTAYEKWYSRQHTQLINAVEARDRAQMLASAGEHRAADLEGQLRLAQLQLDRFKAEYGSYAERELTTTDIHE